MVHDVVPPVVVQFGDPGVVFCTTAGSGDPPPSVSTIETDWVAGETYFGLRAAFEAFAAGMVIVNATFVCCGVCVVPAPGIAGIDDPPPPEQAATAQPSTSAPIENSIFRISIAP
jgi:hypothetical protein